METMLGFSGRMDWLFPVGKPLYRNNGEDIHLSAMCKLLGNIPTYIPRQIVPVESGNVKRYYSADEYALHRKPLFNKERLKLLSDSEILDGICS